MLESLVFKININLQHKFLPNLYNLISQPEPAVGSGEPVGMNVVNEDVCEAVLCTCFVTQREPQRFPRNIAVQNHLLQR